jgi:hypothetical protein
MTNSKPSHKYMGTCLAWPWIVEFYCVVALAPGLLDFNRKLIFMILIQAETKWKWVFRTTWSNKLILCFIESGQGLKKLEPSIVTAIRTNMLVITANQTKIDPAITSFQKKCIVR